MCTCINYDSFSIQTPTHRHLRSTQQSHPLLSSAFTPAQNQPQFVFKKALTPRFRSPCLANSTESSVTGILPGNLLEWLMSHHQKKIDIVDIVDIF